MVSDAITPGTGVTLNTQAIQRVGKVVNLSLVITTPQTSGTLNIGKFSSANAKYRPSISQNVTAMAYSGTTTQKVCQVSIKANGDITCEYHDALKYISLNTTYLAN